MIPISGVNVSAAQPMTAAEVLEAPKVQKSGEEAGSRSLRPARDEYIPEEKREPSGRYWLGKDGDGQPKIYFDSPERAENATDPEEPMGDRDPEEPAGDRDPEGPERSGRKEERCVGNTDKVDREIERLKKEREELEQRLQSETDEAKIRDLERRLAQVDRELRQKDNDTYRKQHSTFARL